ncbi:MAG: hypothetical protein MUF87_10320 [Anaerolineae bacterium]|jgi:hypothetical protein|nr:hypothetical protein [Anaerolineae bacterium]
MTIQVFWDDSFHHVIRYVIEGHWTWDEFYAVHQQARRMASLQPHRVDVIVEALTDDVPPNFLTNLKGIASRQIANAGITVLVSSSRFLSVMLGAGQKLDPNISYYFQAAPTVDEAYRLIEENRTKTGKSETSTP